MYLTGFSTLPTVTRHSIHTAVSVTVPQVVHMMSNGKPIPGDLHEKGYVLGPYTAQK